MGGPSIVTTWRARIIMILYNSFPSAFTALRHSATTRVQASWQSSGRTSRRSRLFSRRRSDHSQDRTSPRAATTGRHRSRRIAPPQNSAQTTSVRSAKTTHDLVGLLIRNSGRDPIHSRLTIQRVAQRSRLESAPVCVQQAKLRGARDKSAPGRCRSSSSVVASNCQPCAQIGRGFERAIAPGIIQFHQGHRRGRGAQSPQIAARPSSSRWVKT